MVQGVSQTEADELPRLAQRVRTPLPLREGLGEGWIRDKRNRNVS
mgnify:CR=1 FL=1